MIDWIDEATGVSGTDVNRKNLMAMQGYQYEMVTFGNDSIVKTNDDDEREVITFTESQIIKNFMGRKEITQTITFTQNGYTKELS